MIEPRVLPSGSPVVLSVSPSPVLESTAPVLVSTSPVLEVELVDPVLASALLLESAGAVVTGAVDPLVALQRVHAELGLTP